MLELKHLLLGHSGLTLNTFVLVICWTGNKTWEFNGTHRNLFSLFSIICPSKNVVMWYHQSDLQVKIVKSPSGFTSRMKLTCFGMFCIYSTRARYLVKTLIGQNCNSSKKLYKFVKTYFFFALFSRRSQSYFVSYFVLFWIWCK